MTRVARAVEKGETRGFLKIHVEEGSKRILGAALLGKPPRAHPPERERAPLPFVLEDLKPL